jgi:archaetidylinositol phosphate synthase
VVLTRLKEKTQGALGTVASAVHRIGLKPDTITVIGMSLALLSAFAYTQWQTNIFYILVAPALLLLSGFCDVLDGAVARIYQQTTEFGGFLDSLLDRYADAAVYLGIILGGLCDLSWGVIALIGSLLVSYSRARAEAAGLKMESIGLAERPERILILAVASLIAFVLKMQTFDVMSTAIILLAVLSNLTVLQRGIYTYKKLKKLQKQLET